ncbi:MAG TPA: Gldg family protein [Hyphomicrobiaceae bacterium]|nr:Gldg family protein [Hyphomicrobiaceae bacterium]
MQSFLDRLRHLFRPATDWLVAHCARLPRHTLAWTSVGLAFILLLSVNLFASSALRNAKADLTQQRLFTISSGTRSMLRSIDEPISLKLYFSKRLGEAAPVYARYFERVRALLQQYADIAGPGLDVAVFDPEPFSDSEDKAVAAGLRGVRLNQEGEVGYFGLVGNNSTDSDSTIPFFTTDREAFLEYDLTKLIYTLAHPKKRVVGLITSLPLDGGMNPMAMLGGGRQQLPPQMIMEQIRDFFDVKTLSQDVKEIPSDIDVLMVAQPDKLTPEAAYAIDQFVMGGGKILALVDPVAEMGGRAGPMGMPPSGPSPEFVKLLKSWGVDFDPSKVAGDIATARRVQFGGGARPTVTEYVGWLGLDRRSIDEKDVLSGGVERLNLASPGFLSKAEGATTQVTPILLTSPQAMQIPADKFTGMPDPVALLRAYKPEGKSLMLAARVSGTANSGYPDGAPKPAKMDGADKAKADAAKEDARPDAPKSDANKDGKPKEEKPEGAAAKPHKASGQINAIVIADTDLLSDQFWVDVRDFLGQQVAIPNASNAAFIVNALDNLSGSDALIALRGRGAEDRPFQLVNDLRRDSERRYREKEQALTAKLKEVQDQLTKLENAGEGGNVIVSESDRQAIEKFRSDMLAIRRELREVKRALREDIDRLDGWLKFANIALVPLLVGVGGIGWAVRQRRRTGPHLPPAPGAQGGTP